MTTRRTFLAASGAALVLADQGRDLLAQTAPDWKKRIGLELFTVRDLLPKDYEGTLAKVAEIGYTEVEPATNYADMEPKAFRAMLDKCGLTAPTTHVGATDGPGSLRNTDMSLRRDRKRMSAPADRMEL